MARAQAQVSGISGSARRGSARTPTYAGALRAARQARGCHVVTADGRDRIDFCNADGTVLLGWSDLRVDAAVAAAARTSASLECEAAERVGALIPSAEAVGFRPTLEAALADALLAAKTISGRDGAFFCDDGVTARGDVSALESAFAEHHGQIAALVVRPLDATRAFLGAARRLTTQDGALLVLDESRSAFRVHAGGAQALHGVAPDITLLGASMANGRPLAAIAGQLDVMNVVEGAGARIPATALAAARATLERIQHDDVPDVLRLRGAEIEAEVEARLRRTGADRLLTIYADPTWSLVSATPGDDVDGDAVEAALNALLYDFGVLSFGSHVPSLATGDYAVACLLDAYDAALPQLVDRADRGEFRPRLRRSALAQ